MTIRDFFRSKPAPPREQLLAATILRNTAVKESATKNGLKLAAPLRASKLRQVLAGSRPSATKTFELDALGVFVWQAIDNQKTVEQLIRHFAKEKRLTLREAEVSILAFLKTLTQRGLIALAPGPAEPPT